MSKSKFNSFNVAEKFITQMQPQAEEMNDNIEQGAAEPVVAIQSEDVAKKRGRPKMQQSDEVLVQRGYYVTQKHIRAIKLKAVEDNIDQSSIVRAALDLYFGN